MSAIDHKAKAESLLRFESSTENAELGRDAANVALVHATLAVAEQARIANLLTVATAEANLLNPLSEGHQYSPVFTAIREGLDI